MKREIFEEMSLKVYSLEFLGILECSWLRNGVNYHEINIIYGCKINDMNIHSAPTSTEDRLRFLWYPIDKLDNCNILPIQLRDAIMMCYKKVSIPFFYSNC